MRNITKIEIDKAIAETISELKDGFCFTKTMISNIKNYQTEMEMSDKECDKKLKKYSLEMGIMATAIQCSTELTRGVLYKLLCED